MLGNMRWVKKKKNNMLETDIQVETEFLKSPPETFKHGFFALRTSIKLSVRSLAGQ